MQKRNKQEKILWETKDKIGRRIVFTQWAFNHITKRHPSESILTVLAK